MLSGLSEDELLSCLTTRPAKQLGLSSIVGTIEVGRMANMVLLDGPLFGEKTHVMATMVAGDKVNVYEPVIFGFNGPCTLKSEAIEFITTIQETKGAMYQPFVAANFLMERYGSFEQIQDILPEGYFDDDFFKYLQNFKQCNKTRQSIHNLTKHKTYKIYTTFTKHKSLQLFTRLHTILHNFYKCQNTTKIDLSPQKKNLYTNFTFFK
jgi:hypothetical protein